MNLIFIFEIESSYEQTLSNKSLDFFRPEQRKYISWLMTLEKRDFLKFYKNSSDLLLQAQSLNEKVFILSWLIVATEVEFNMSQRDHYLQQLEKLNTEDFNLYLEYQKVYFKSISHFYNADLLISETLINKALQLAERLNYVRGQARCLFQKSLIYNETYRLVEFKKTVNQGIEITSHHLLLKTKEKLLNLIIKENSSTTLSNTTEDKKIEQLLNKASISLQQNDLKYARQLIAQAEVLRRKLGFGKDKYSIFYYYTLFYLKSDQFLSAYRLLNNIKDHVLRYQIYDFMLKNYFTLNHSQLQDFKKIELQLDIYTEDQTKNESFVYNRINLKQIKNESVQKLLSTLAKYESIDKEHLFQSVYDLAYDPVIHDSKIYKLILKAKKEISADLIINSYGKYSLNSEKYKIIS